MDPREMRFRAAADEIIRSNRKIRDHIRSVKDFYLGNSNAPIPPIQNRLETILNPKCNGACPCFERLTVAAKEYRPGEYPVHVLDLLHKTTLDLIHNEIEPIQRTQVCNRLVTLVEDLHGYLSTPAADFKLETHCSQLDKFRTQWSQCCCKNSDAFYERTSAILAARENPAKNPPPEPSQKKRKQADWRKDDPSVLKRREDTKRVLAEIRNRHKATGRSYAKIIDEMKRSPVWGARMRHMGAASWRAKAISRPRA